MTLTQNKRECYSQLNRLSDTRYSTSANANARIQ